MPAHELNPAVTAAEASVAAKAPAVAGDPNRPVYHFRPPCCWMNDPNGTIYHDGWYHVFYQFNPYADVSGTIHWGHTRSRDLVHWEQLPIAIWPSNDLGEEGCWSGCAAVNGKGEPMVFYTSYGTGNARPFEQWAAVGDEEWLTWRKHPDNPILALGEGGVPEFERSWRDPFIFNSAGRTFLVLGAATDEQANVALFESDDPELADWDYRGLLYSKPRSEMPFCECPNFFPLGDKFVLLLSPYRTVEYTIGDFDPDGASFTTETHGILDPGVSRLDHRGNVTDEIVNPNYYATNILYDSDGNCILFGWVRGFQSGQGWNGCLALPRVLTLGADGRPRQHPVPALQQLRGAQLVETGEVRLEDEAQPLAGVSGDALELQVTLTLETATRAGVRLRAGADGERGLSIEYDGSVLRINETVVELPESPQLTLHVFLDKTVMEVFVNDGTRAITQVAYPRLEDRDVWLYAEGGAAAFTDLRAWEVSPIW
jgi:sucrose-6-phosphate hydrolase SacC (GH32 family)